MGLMHHRDPWSRSSLGRRHQVAVCGRKESPVLIFEYNPSGRRTLDDHGMSVHGPKVPCRRYYTASEPGPNQLAFNTKVIHDLKVSTLRGCNPTIRLGLCIRITTIVSLASMPSYIRQAALNSIVQVRNAWTLPVDSHTAHSHR